VEIVGKILGEREQLKIVPVKDSFSSKQSVTVNLSWFDFFILELPGFGFHEAIFRLCVLQE
jgi:hypothetical protein